MPFGAVHHSEHQIRNHHSSIIKWQWTISVRVSAWQTTSPRTYRHAIEQVERRGDPNKHGPHPPIAGVDECKKAPKLGANGAPRGGGADWRWDSHWLASSPQQAAQKTACARRGGAVS